MAKPEDFPAFEDWTAPWGEDGPDPDKAAKLVYSLRKAEHTAKAKITELKAEVGTLTEKVEEQDEAIETFKDASEKGAKADPAVEAELKKVTRERDKLKKELDTAKGDDLYAARLEIALEKGLTKRQALRLVGDDRDALEEDADELREELGLSDDDDKDGDDDAKSKERDEDGNLRRTPRRKGKANLDPDPNAGPEIDVLGKLDELIPR